MTTPTPSRIRPGALVTGRQKNFDRFRKATGYFEEQRAKLLAKYPDQWVAIYGRRVVGAHADVRQLLDELQQKGIPLNHALLKHLTTKEEDWALSS